jgi:DNA-binding XRE family transcriptional regulator
MGDGIRALRERRGWSQQELADRAGVTRQLVGAVEAGRHAPNVSAALGLARALGSTVEALFDDAPSDVRFLSDALPTGTPVVAARVGDAVVAVPMAHGMECAEQWAFSDAVVGSTGLSWLPDGVVDGLVIAGCDPVLGLLASAVQRSSGCRVVTAHASTGRSIASLRDGLVHGVVVHAPVGELPEPPVRVQRWRLARWQVGLAGVNAVSLEQLAERRATVVQRDAGAGSQRAFERALAGVGASSLPGPVGEGHLDVARRVSHGGGRAGVTMEAAAVAFGLQFQPLEEHTVELWLDDRWATMPAASAVIDMLNGASFRKRAALLNGYDVTECGARC